MLKDDLKCVLIGRDVGIYTDLARLIRKVDPSSRFKQVDLKKAAIIATLKKMSGPGLIFISDEVPFSLEVLSDLTWQYNADAIIVIVTTKSSTVSIKKFFNNTLFSRINLDKRNSHKTSTLQFLIQSARQKADFRRCKNLLGIAEKRCQWLVDSSREAVAFVSRDIHWYANPAYLQLFGISSVQELRSITVKDIIVPDEHLLFEGFQQNQGRSSGKRKSLMLSMKKLNGSMFRANIYLIPSVFKGHKCYQLWIRKINSLTTTTGDKEELKTTAIQDKSKISTSRKPDLTYRRETKEDENPFSSLIKEGSDAAETTRSKQSDQQKNSTQAAQSDNSNQIILKKEKLKPSKKSYDQNSLLKGVIRRKEASLISIPLHYLKKNENRDKKPLNHQIVSLKVAAAQKKGVDDLLLKLPESFNQKMRSVFWDKVKFSRIIQTLLQRKQLANTLLIQINEASMLDDSFIKWLSPGLKRLGNKSKNLTFLIPSNISENHYKQTLKFIKKLKKLKCQIALDSFMVTKKSMVLLRYAQPEYVRLSLPWTRQIQSNESKEIKLSSIIRQFENKNIKVIAPCGYSKDMRRLFVLSGASFCQERTIKTV